MGVTPSRSLRPLVWLWHMALPLLALWLLIARPAADLIWEHHAWHLWLVLATALLELLLAAMINHEAVRHDDGRLFLVSLAFGLGAAFLGVHALATPGHLIGRNAGFVLATPVGLVLAAFGCASSAFTLSDAAARRLIDRRVVIRWVLAAVVAFWAFLTLGEHWPLDTPLSEGDADAWLLALLIVGTAAFVVAAFGYWQIYRRTSSVMAISAITAFVLLAETLAIIAFSRSWHLSWWLWHILMAIAFGFFAYSAHDQWRREGTARSLFAGIGMDTTLVALREEYSAALLELTDAIEAGTAAGPSARALAERYGLSERQRDILVQAAAALSSERRQIRRQRAVAAVVAQPTIDASEAAVLERFRELVATEFEPDRVEVRLVSDGVPADAAVDTGNGDGHHVVLPITIQGKHAGALDVRSADPLDERDRALYETLASHVSIAVENVRLYRELDGLFRSYMSPDVAASLLADPSQAALGGGTEVVTVLMADLVGFTPFAERTPPAEVVEMLNAQYSTLVPIILGEGGTVVQFVGDALMAVFNAPVRQPDHVLRAARAALACQRASAALVAEHPGWPRFRMGINTGPALVGNVGADQMRNYTAIGDTTNVAARLESIAGVGEVVVGPATWAALGEAAIGASLGPVSVKGRQQPVDAHRLDSVGGGAS